MPTATSATNFAGFSAETFEFFDQLASHNERPWFQAHRERYERLCREPMRQLIAALGGDPDTSRITRINRDTRFSRNKAPYRTYIAGGVDGNYLHLSAAALYVGTGIYKPEARVLERFREAIVEKASGPRLQKIVTSLREKGYDVETHERLKSAPRGFAADHPRIDLLRMKDIFAGKTFPRAPWLCTTEALDRVRKTIADIRPLRDWIRDNVE